MSKRIYASDGRFIGMSPDENDYEERIESLQSQLQAKTEECERLRKLGLQLASAEIAGCRVPSQKTGNQDEEGDCEKCGDSRAHCFERMMFDRLAARKDSK